MITMTPEIHNLSDYPFKHIHKVISEKAADLGVDYLDFFNRMQSIEAQDIWAMKGDPHPNEKGHLVMAESLVRYFLVKKPWLNS